MTWNPFDPDYRPEDRDDLLVKKAKAPEPADPEAEASDFSVESYLPGEHVYVQLAQNFPPKAIAWVRRATWVGPVMVPWSQIDSAGKKTWAASHQPDKVNSFKKQIAAHDGHVGPSILVREKNGKSFIVDGHHRALAREEMGQDVLAYVGTVISRKDYLEATETHSSQVHQGSDPANKRQMVSKESVDYRPGTTARNCGNCVMFHQDGTCDLVKGKILPGDVCDKWEPK